MWHPHRGWSVAESELSIAETTSFYSVEEVAFLRDLAILLFDDLIFINPRPHRLSDLFGANKLHDQMTRVCGWEALSYSILIEMITEF